jgi:hypothetical protein
MRPVDRKWRKRIGSRPGVGESGVGKTGVGKTGVGKTGVGGKRVEIRVSIR